MTAVSSDTRQDRNGRMIRVGSKVHDHFHHSDGVVVQLGRMCWIEVPGREQWGAAHYEDVEVLA